MGNFFLVFLGFRDLVELFFKIEYCSLFLQICFIETHLSLQYEVNPWINKNYVAEKTQFCHFKSQSRFPPSINCDIDKVDPNRFQLVQLEAELLFHLDGRQFFQDSHKNPFARGRSSRQEGVFFINSKFSVAWRFCLLRY